MNELGQLATGTAVILVMMVGASLMIGGPKLAGRYLKWLLKTVLNVAEWLVTLPINILRQVFLGRPRKKKKGS